MEIHLGKRRSFRKVQVLEQNKKAPAMPILPAMQLISTWQAVLIPQ
jgi:hypothetical protein